MNDEIKEILDYYKKDAEKFEYLMKDYTEEQLKTTFSRSYQRYRNHKLLLDYITNLQQEIEKLNEDKRGMLVQLYKANDDRDKIQQENERLKEDNRKKTKRCTERNHRIRCRDRKLERRDKKVSNLQHDNERLKETIKHYEDTTTFGDYVKEVNLLIDYKSCCEKAIEYMKQHEKDGTLWLVKSTDDLLNILQNGSDDK